MKRVKGNKVTNFIVLLLTVVFTACFFTSVAIMAYAEDNSISYDETTDTVTVTKSGGYELYFIPNAYATAENWIIRNFNFIPAISAIANPEDTVTITYCPIVNLTIEENKEDTLEIQSEAFENNSNLETLTIKGNKVVINGLSFSGCDKLKELTIDCNDVEFVAARGGAFENCSALENINIKANNISIDKYTFRSCDSLPTLTLNGKNVYIGDNAFESCNALTEVTLEGDVVQIKDYAFAYCESLEKVTFGEGVSEIGDSVFSDVYMLQYVIFKGTVGSNGDGIDDNAFEGVGDETEMEYCPSIVFPDSWTGDKLDENGYFKGGYFKVHEHFYTDGYCECGEEEPKGSEHSGAYEAFMELSKDFSSYSCRECKIPSLKSSVLYEQFLQILDDITDTDFTKEYFTNNYTTNENDYENNRSTYHAYVGKNEIRMRTGNEYSSYSVHFIPFHYYEYYKNIPEILGMSEDEIEALKNTPESELSEDELGILETVEMFEETYYAPVCFACSMVRDPKDVYNTWLDVKYKDGDKSNLAYSEDEAKIEDEEAFLAKLEEIWDGESAYETEVDDKGITFTFTDGEDEIILKVSIEAGSTLPTLEEVIAMLADKYFVNEENNLLFSAYADSIKYYVSATNVCGGSDESDDISYSPNLNILFVIECQDGYNVGLKRGDDTRAFLYLKIENDTVVKVKLYDGSKDIFIEFLPASSNKTSAQLISELASKKYVYEIEEAEESFEFSVEGNEAGNSLAVSFGLDITITEFPTVIELSDGTIWCPYSITEGLEEAIDVIFVFNYDGEEISSISFLGFSLEPENDSFTLDEIIEKISAVSDTITNSEENNLDEFINWYIDTYDASSFDDLIDQLRSEQTPTFSVNGKEYIISFEGYIFTATLNSNDDVVKLGFYNIDYDDTATFMNLGEIELPGSEIIDMVDSVSEQLMLCTDEGFSFDFDTMLEGETFRSKLAKDWSDSCTYAVNGNTHTWNLGGGNIYEVVLENGEVSTLCHTYKEWNNDETVEEHYKYEELHVDHDGIEFEPWVSADHDGVVLPNVAGNWYLTEDVALVTAWSAPAGITNLCLNGKIITIQNGGMIKISKTATLNLFDCSEKEHKGNIDTKTKYWSLGEGNEESTPANINGGIIYINRNYSIFYIVGTFNMYGATITGYAGGNYSTIFNGALLDEEIKKIGHAGNFNMYGGAITGNVYTNGMYQYTHNSNFGIIDASKFDNFTVGKDAVIDGNYMLGYDNIEGSLITFFAKCNVITSTTSVIKLGTGKYAPTSNMKIGIRTQVIPTSTKPMVFTEKNAQSYIDCFECNMDGMHIESRNKNALYLCPADVEAYVPHDCVDHKETVTGKAATCTEDGWKDYYKCKTCGYLYTDETMENEITDLEAWKKGDGKIAKTGHKKETVTGKTATCTEDGWKDYYKCTVCNKYYSDEAMTSEITDLEAWKVGNGKIAKTGHEYGTPTYTWSEDHMKCTAKIVCKHDASHVETEEEVTLTDDDVMIVQLRNCETDELTQYKAKFKNTVFETQTVTVKTADKTGHNYFSRGYTWSENNTKCTAKRECIHCGKTETEEVTATSWIGQSRTCTDDEITVYAAYFTNSAFSTQTNYIKTADKLGHNFKFEVNGNVLTATCQNDHNHSETFTLEAIDRAFNSGEYDKAVAEWNNNDKYGFPLWPTYTYYVDENTKTTTENSGAVVEGSAPKYAGNYIVKASLEINGVSYTVEKSFAVTKLVIDKVGFKDITPTANEVAPESMNVGFGTRYSSTVAWSPELREGKFKYATAYTATVTLEFVAMNSNNCVFADEVTIMPVTGEGWTISATSTETTLVLTKTYAKTADAPTKVNGQTATCENDGWKDYYQENDKYYVDIYKETEITDLEAWKVGNGKIVKTSHTKSKIDGKTATCTEDGWKDYYKCTVCNKYYSDEIMETEITDLEAWKVGDGKTEKTGHDWDDEFTVDIESTLEQEGSKSIHCKNCNEVKDVTPIDKKTSTIKTTEDEKVVVEIETEGGFNTNVELVVEVVVKATVQAQDKELMVDYSDILKKNEKLLQVYDVKLFMDGVEVQPSDIKDDMVITVKMEVPENLAKKFKIFHVHNSNDITELKLGEEAGIGTYIIDENGYLVTKIDKLSEFAFANVKNNFPWWLIIIVIVILSMGGAYYFYRKGKTNKNNK